MLGLIFAIGVGLAFLAGAVFSFRIGAVWTDEDMKRWPEVSRMLHWFGPEGARRYFRICGYLGLLAAVVIPVVMVLVIGVDL